MNLFKPRSKPYVLVTGATGMVGSQLIARLLARQVPVAVLVRDSAATAGQRSISAVDRIEHLLAKFESYWDRRLKRPVVLTGDINTDGLGLCDDSMRFLDTHCSSVIHSAASLSFRPASESAVNEPYRSNVGGTSNVAAVCSKLGFVDFHYISTAYVCGLRPGRVAETDSLCGQQFANDYEQSKLQAEQLLKERYRWERLTIYRPSIVIDGTGLAPISQDRTVYSAFSMFYSLATKFGLPEFGTWSGNLGLSGKECKNLVEAAWVAEVVAGVFEEPKLHGRTYHLTSRTGTPTSEMERAFHEVTTQSFREQGLAVPDPGAGELSGVLGTGESSHRVSQARAGSLTGSAVLDAIAAPFVEAYLPHFRDDPVFDRTNIDAALQKLGLCEQAEIDSAVLAAMIRLPGCFGPSISRRSAATSSPSDAVGVEERADSASSRLVNAGGTSIVDLLRRSAKPACAVATCRLAWGFIICGSRGGDYRVELRERLHIALGGESCNRRIYVSGDDCDLLVNGDREVSELVTSGRLLIECDEESSAVLPDDVQNSLAIMIECLREELRSTYAAAGTLVAAGKDR